jgi:adenosylcobinamide-phosphate synthase
VTPPDSLVIILALLLDLAIGDPSWLPHPVIAIGRLIHFLDKRLRFHWLNERLAGVLLLSLVVISSAGITWLLLHMITALFSFAGWIAAVIISATCLASRSLHTESARVAAALLAGDLHQARRYLSFIVGRDTEHLDESEIWRAVVETVAENTSDGIIAPLFWLTIGGPVCAMSYKAVSTLDSMVGYKNDKYLHLGWASARMDDFLNFIPARLTALLLVISAPLAGCSLMTAARIAVRDRLNHPSPNSGYPEAAAAGALGVRLGGAASYNGVPSWKEYIGEQQKPLDEHAYNSMIKLMYISTVLMAIGCMMAAFLLRGSCVPFI